VSGSGLKRVITPFTIGVSCHSVYEVEQAEHQQADFALFAPILRRRLLDRAVLRRCAKPASAKSLYSPWWCNSRERHGLSRREPEGSPRFDLQENDTQTQSDT
jgi:hypothetical protein